MTKGEHPMAEKVNLRMARLAQSEIRAMTQACELVRGVNMAQGVCDTPVPSVVSRNAQQAIDLGLNTYTRFDGSAVLRKAISKKLNDYNGIAADPEAEITVSAGATGSFHCACLAFLNPDDEVIVFEPYYAYHITAITSVSAVPRIVPMKAPDWSWSQADLEASVTARTKAIVVNSPGNPSGKVFDRGELERIAEVARRHDLLVFTDEIYEYFLFDGRRHVSMATLPDMRERTVTIGGYSKTYSITGWRIGYSIAVPKWAQVIGAMNDLIYVCAPAPLQYGVAKGIEELPASFYDDLAREYQRKRDRFCLALQKAALPPSVPEGAYYVLADVSRLPGTTGKERAMHLLDKTGIAGVPGEAFFAGSDGHRFVRFCFAKTDADLADACRRLEQLH
jgi:aminotransferase